MPSSLVQKTILHSSDIFLIPNKSLSFMIAIFPATHPCNSDIINSESIKYPVFHDKDTLIKLSFSQ